MGKVIFHILAGFSEFEWSIRKERQADGMIKAKQKGIKLGRRAKLTQAAIKSIHQKRAEGTTIAQLKTICLSRALIYRALNTVS